MLKYKSLILIVILSAVLLAAGVTVGVVSSRSSSASFAGDGYVMNVTETEDGLQAEPLYFAGGTAYKTVYPGDASFKDIMGNHYTVSRESFVHYSDESISAMSDGVVVNLDDINSGLVNFYAIPAQTVLAAGSDGLTVDNNGNTLTFRNMLWKTGDSDYLIYSDSISLTMPDGQTREIDGYLQAQYLEDGIVRLVTEDAAWQVVAANCTARTADGVQLKFENKILSDSNGTDRMTLGEILMDAEDNIKVQSLNDWVPPKFEFTAIDGQAGEAGEEGQAGEQGVDGEQGQQGQAGEQGEIGEDGSNGEVGPDGSSGDSGRAGSAGDGGQSGGHGNNGSIPQNTTEAQATMNLISFDLNSGSLTGQVSVIDEDGVLTENTGKIQIINTATGSPVEVVLDGGDVAEEMTFSDGDEITFTCENLNPNTEYRLVVSSEYTLNDSPGGTKDFINRTFYTDASGVFLNLEYATTSSFEAVVNTKAYSNATSARIVITSADGRTAILNEEVVSLPKGEQEITLDLTQSEVGWSSYANTSYKVELQVLEGGTYHSTGQVQTWKTLKEVPKLGKSAVYTNSGGYFEMQVAVESDPHQSITGYVYHVYNYSTGEEVLYSGHDLVVAKNTGVPLYLESGLIERDTHYYMRAEAVYYDNEKTLRIWSDPSDEFYLGDSGEVSVSWTNNENYPTETALDGILTIDQKNISELPVTQEYPLTVMVESSGNYKKTFSFTDVAAQTEGEKINIPIKLEGLKSDSSYRISAWGYVRENAGTGDEQLRYTLLGDYVVRTASYNTMKATLTPYQSDTAISALLFLGEDTAVEQTTEARVLTRVEVTLKVGNANGTQVGNTYVLMDENTDFYESSISDQYYGQTGAASPLEITNLDFQLTSNDLSSSIYYMEVTAAYDYTYSYNYTDSENVSGYRNQIPLETTGITINVSNKVPELPRPLDNAVTATPVLNEDLRGRFGLSPVEGLNDDTIVGYTLQAQYSNDADLARTVTYYGLKADELTAYQSLSQKPAGDVTLWENGSHVDFAYTLEAEGGGEPLPSLTVLFIEPPATASTDPLSALNADETAGIKGAARAGEGGSGNPYIYEYNGNACVFTQGDNNQSLERGHHYVFAYKARLWFNNVDYIYPNDYRAEFIYGETLLRSQVQAVPRQATQVKMYLDHVDVNGVSSGPVWKMWIEDTDETWDSTYNSDGYTNGLQASGSSYMTVNLGNEQNDGSRTVKIVTGTTGSSSLLYNLSMYQQYYDADETYENVNEDRSDSQALVSHEYASPKTWAEIQSDNAVTITGSYPQGSNTINLTFQGEVLYMNRIAWVQVRAYKYENGVKGRSPVYTSSGNPTKTSAGARNYEIDLTRLGANGIIEGDEIGFEVTVYYDTGEVGFSQLSDTSPTYAVQGTQTGTYLIWYHSRNTNTNSYDAYKRFEAGLYNSDYKVTIDEALTEDGISLTLQNTRDVTTGSSVPEDIKNLELPLVFGPKGAEYLEDGESQGQGDYVTLKKIDDYNVGQIKLTQGESTTQKDTVTMGVLRPAVSWINLTPGISTIDMSFSSSSYDLIEPDADGNRYMIVRVYEVGENEADQGTSQAPAYEEKVAIQEGTNTYEVSAENLSPNKWYKITISAVPQGTDQEDLALYPRVNRPTAQFWQQTMENLEISGAVAEEIVYESYNRKYVRIDYVLPTITGYQIEYTMERRPAGSPDEAAYDSGWSMSHEDVMQLMGYTWNEETQTWQNQGVDWSYRRDMSEIISLDPELDTSLKRLEPGYDYRLKISAYTLTDDHAPVTKEDTYIRFTWPELTDPSPYIESTGTADRLHINAVVADSNRVVVGDSYLLAYRNADGEPWRAVQVNANLNNRLNYILEAQQATTYQLGIFAVKDMDNTGGLTALTLDGFNAMIEAEQNAYLLTSTTGKTQDAWGGSIGKVAFRQSGNGVQVILTSTTGADKITEIEATASRVADDGTVENLSQVLKAGTTSLFTYETGRNRYTLLIPFGIQTPDEWNVTIKMKVGSTVIYTYSDQVSFD